VLSLKSVLTAVLLSALLGACASTEPKKDVTVEEQGTGADTAGGAERGRLEGEALGTRGARADLLSQRRVHFAFDSSAIDEEGRAIIQAHAEYLAANPQIKLKLEGHCDERGTREYNLALGERRAQSVDKLMRVLGVDGKRVTNNSYGEEKPIAPEHDESAWRMNRRVEIIY
jgi:peptidoglycan-associated lipoprotein